jgi:peptidoglycan/xylan/chitin deacetylase (PgdA/CDA1 family)
VALTFDDGWKSLWSIAYPLLRKYGLVGISFIVPTWIQDTDNPSPNLEDLWSGRTSLTELTASENASDPHISWHEARIMAESGVIDFQSHSLTHETVFTSEKIVDFLNPKSSGYAYKVPDISYTEKATHDLRGVLGRPLYTFAPRLAGARRFFDDQQLRHACISYVEQNGGENFFGQRSWRRGLWNIVERYRKNNRAKCWYETDEQRANAISRELRDSKQVIEDTLQKPVKHLCYPFYSGSSMALEKSKQCGYKTNFWGWQAPANSRNEWYGQEHLYKQVDITDFSVGNVLAGRRTNRRGDDPYRIVRVPGDYIFRLPGKGRRRFSEIIIKKCIRSLKKN